MTIPTISMEPLPPRCDNTLAISAEFSVLVDAADKPLTTKRSTWHQRQSQEMRHLQNMVQQLSVKLRELKRAAEMHPTDRKARNAGAAKRVSVKKTRFKTQAPEGVRMWRGIAERQLKLRQSCEMENVRLRKALRFHFRRARSYERALKLRLPGHMLEASMNLVGQHQTDTIRATIRYCSALNE